MKIAPPSLAAATFTVMVPARGCTTDEPSTGGATSAPVPAGSRVVVTRAGAFPYGQTIVTASDAGATPGSHAHHALTRLLHDQCRPNSMRTVRARSSRVARP